MNTKLSKRDEKTELLWNELKYWGLISWETDRDAVKAIANELPWRMLMRVINKLKRKRGDIRDIKNCI